MKAKVYKPRRSNARVAVQAVAVVAADGFLHLSAPIARIRKFPVDFLGILLSFDERCHFAKLLGRPGPHMLPKGMRWNDRKQLVEVGAGSAESLWMPAVLLKDLLRETNAEAGTNHEMNLAALIYEAASYDGGWKLWRTR